MHLTARLAQLIGGIVLFGCLAALAFVAWGGFRALRYEQVDDEEHLERKRVYLEQIEKRAPNAEPSQRPNILLILFDDLGYADLGAYGSISIATPNIDRLASEGLRVDNDYAPASVCTSSRAAMLTGRYASRAGLNIVAFPSGHPLDLMMKASGIDVRLPAEEILIPEILKAAGYRTGRVGKWQLGDQAPSLPTRLGFDSYLGALYSNDMTPFAIYHGEEVAYSAPFDQTQLNEVYTQAALEFLEQKSDQPFFLYYAHNFPHIPLFRSEPNAGRSDAGVYGDVVESLDDSVGAILERLEETGVLDNTLVLLTSGNGPWYEGNPATTEDARTRPGRAGCGSRSSPIGLPGLRADEPAIFPSSESI